MINYNELFDGIGLSESGRQTFYTLLGDKCGNELDNLIAATREAFDAGNEAFEKYVLESAERASVEPERMQLYLSLLLCDRAHDRFRALGVDDSIYYTSMADICDKCSSNEQTYGIYGIPVSEIPWFRYHLTGILFRLGRFQYQIAKSEYDVEINGHKLSKGDTCFFVHIPGNEPLTPEACESSYRMAYEFFHRHLGCDVMFCFCYSWLLQPWLSDVLSPDCNIMRFAGDYKLLETIQSIPHTFRFIFPCEYASLDEYPADNALRCMAIKRRREGDLVGYGVGVMLLASR